MTSSPRRRSAMSLLAVRRSGQMKYPLFAVRSGSKPTEPNGRVAAMALEGGGGDGETDHDRLRRSAMGTTSAGVGKQKDAHASMSSRRLSSASLRR